MEILLQSQSLLTHTLTNARNEDDITPSLMKEYHESLEKLEPVGLESVLILFLAFLLFGPVYFSTKQS